MRITLKAIDLDPQFLWSKIFSLNYPFFKTKDSYVFPCGDKTLIKELELIRQEYFLKGKTIIITTD